eukprot:5343052-Prymnesium_polylepis.1
MSLHPVHLVPQKRSPAAEAHRTQRPLPRQRSSSWRGRRKSAAARRRCSRSSHRAACCCVRRGRTSASGPAGRRPQSPMLAACLVEFLATRCPRFAADPKVLTRYRELPPPALS